MHTNTSTSDFIISHWLPSEIRCDLYQLILRDCCLQHHCRNCGEIYCQSCSDNTMPLPSSAKPVRVCDACHTILLQRYSAT